MKGIFAERFSEWRALKNLTLKDVEKRTNIPAQTLSRYELDQRVPKYDVAKVIAEKLNINVLWLQGYDVPMEDDYRIEPLNEKELVELIAHIRAVDADVQRSFLSLARQCSKVSNHRLLAAELDRQYHEQTNLSAKHSDDGKV